MATTTELVNELARLTNKPKVTFKGKSKEKLIILLHETRKRKNYPKRGKHVWLGTPRKRRKSRRKSRRSSSLKHRKHVWLVSPRSRPRRRRKSPKRHKSRRRSSPRRRPRRRSSPRRHIRSKSVSWGGKHVTYGSPTRKKRYSARRARRSSLRHKRSYLTRISSPGRRRSTPRSKIASWKRVYASPRRRNSRRRSLSRSRSRRVRSPTKKHYVDELARLTGRTKKYYNSWPKPELAQRLDAAQDERWIPKHGKHVWVSTPPKRSRRISRKRSRRSSRKHSKKKTYKTECKSYQTRVNGRCRNKPCKKDKIRDNITKKCRKKKSGGNGR